METPKCQHYLRIHKKVMLRYWLDASDTHRDAIANDVAHTGDQFGYFEKKVALDAQRLFEDPSYYDNQEFTFRVPRCESLVYAEAA
jgi:hypothetical protein